MDVDIQNENHCDTIYYDLAIWRRFPINPLREGIIGSYGKTAKDRQMVILAKPTPRFSHGRRLNVQPQHAMAIPKDLGLRFTYALEKGMHMSVTTSVKEDKQEAKHVAVEAAWRRSLLATGRLSHGANYGSGSWRSPRRPTAPLNVGSPTGTDLGLIATKQGDNITVREL